MPAERLKPREKVRFCQEMGFVLLDDACSETPRHQTKLVDTSGPTWEERLD